MCSNNSNTSRVLFLRLVLIESIILCSYDYHSQICILLQHVTYLMHLNYNTDTNTTNNTNNGNVIGMVLEVGLDREHLLVLMNSLLSLIHVSLSCL